MSIAEKLQTISDNVQRVYDAGYAKGRAEGSSGGSTETDTTYYDTFWDAFQKAELDENGEMQSTKIDYYYAFANKHWNDDIYNPKYPRILMSPLITKYPIKENRIISYPLNNDRRY